MINKLYTQHCEMLFRKTILDKELCFTKDCKDFVATIANLKKEQ